VHSSLLVRPSARPPAPTLFPYTPLFRSDGGLSLPNLRSLGSGRTLTLVDGRRHVGSNGGSLAVDVDTIPRLLIQNIEIITGGAEIGRAPSELQSRENLVCRLLLEKKNRE